MIGRLKDMTMSRSGEWVISISTPVDFREAFDELAGKELEIEIKQHRKRRSLDANGFAWALINQIAARLQEKEPQHGWTPTEVYRTAMRDVAGASSVQCIPNDQVDQFIQDWRNLGIGFQAEVWDSKIEGCKTGVFWKGSHLYDTQQMSTLIDILIQEAEQLGIPTITESEAEKLVGNWKPKNNGKDR